MIAVKFVVLPGGKLPERKTEGAACADCYARIDPVIIMQTIHPGETGIVPLGFKLAVPDGYYAEIRPRSGLSSKGIIEIMGTIDSDYRGEVGAIIFNGSKEDFRICNGDRICQMMIKKEIKYEISVVDELDETERGNGGFGSTGVK